MKISLSLKKRRRVGRTSSAFSSRPSIANESANAAHASRKLMP